VNNDNIPKKRAYHHGNLRQALVAAALRAVADDGPDGFTLRDVARRAGVSAAAPYRHFADKDALLAAVAIECALRLGAVTTSAVALAPPGDPLAKFRATGIAYVQFATEHPAHFRALTTPGILAMLPDAERTGLEAWGAEQRRELEAAQAAGHIAAIPLDELLLAANAIVHGLAHLIVEGQLGEVDPATATHLAVAVTGVLGQGLIPREGGLAPDELRGKARIPRGHITGGKLPRRRKP
jgi:AcrR family transcriptional regulator